MCSCIRWNSPRTIGAARVYGPECYPRFAPGRNGPHDLATRLPARAAELDLDRSGARAGHHLQGHDIAHLVLSNGCAKLLWALDSASVRRDDHITAKQPGFLCGGPFNHHHDYRSRRDVQRLTLPEGQLIDCRGPHAEERRIRVDDAAPFLDVLDQRLYLVDAESEADVLAI